MTISRARRRLFHLRTSRSISRDIGDELSFHLDARTDELVRGGMTPDLARAQATWEYGNVDESRRELEAVDRSALRRIRIRERLASWVHDARYAVRGFQRQPVYALVVVATLALGIGANSAVLTLVDAAFLRPLPYRDAAELVHLWDIARPAGEHAPFSYPNLVDLRAQLPSTTGLEAYDQTNLTLTTTDAASRVRGAHATMGFFPLLGVTVARGRLLDSADFRSADVVLVSDRFWRNELGARPDAVGQSVTLDGVARTIVGVLPADFHFAPVQDAAIWLPLVPGDGALTRRGLHWLNVVTRLAPKASIETLRAELRGAMQRLETAYPAENGARTAIAVPMREETTYTARPVLLLLIAASAVVLLIACLNVASLMLARLVARSHEIAIRNALGAAGSRLAQLLFAESFVIAAVGGALGVLFALGASRWLIMAIPPEMRLSMPYLDYAGVNGVVLAISTVLVVGCGMVFGVVPSVQLRRGGIAHVLRQGGRGSTSGGHRARRVLVIAEVALTVVLLVGAGLMTRSVTALQHSDVGFDVHDVVTARVALAGPAYQTRAAQRQFFDRLVGTVAELPGVERVGAVSNPPFNPSGTRAFNVVGAPASPPSNRPSAIMRGVAGAYFETLRIPLVAGRAFETADDSAAPFRVIISASIAARDFPGASPLNRRILFDGDTIPATIIGVAGDVRTGSFDQPPQPTIYYSHHQVAENRLTLMVRSANAAQTIEGIRHAVHAMDPSLPLYLTETMEERIGRMPEFATRRFSQLLITGFAGAALLLAVVGLYGVVAYSVAARTAEIGVRMAMGAQSGSILRLVLHDSMRLAAAGTAIGVVASWWATRWLGSLLYDVKALDTTTYVGVAALVAVVAVLAAAVPAWRAMRVDPIRALRGH